MAAAFDPWAAAFGTIGGALQAPSSGPTDAKAAGSIGTSFDSSGWNVVFGDGSSIDSMRSQSTPTVSTTGGSLSQATGGAMGASLGLGGIDQKTLLLLVAAVVAVKLLKKRST